MWTVEEIIYNSYRENIILNRKYLTINSPPP